MRLKRKLLCLCVAAALSLSFTVPTLAAGETAQFSDLSPDAWYVEAVDYVVGKGIMEGTAEGTFEPSLPASRAAVFTAIYNLAGKPAAATPSTFTDVAGTGYASAAAWAESTGLAAVPADGLFHGERTITRAETATILARYGALIGAAVDTSGVAMKEAPDYGTIPAWALDGMAYCYNGKLMTGNEVGQLNPNGNVTRIELAALMLNASKLSASAPAFQTVSVTIQNGTRAIPAVITTPAGEGPFPAVVMNHGHGGSKDEGAGFVGIAEALARQGILTIRMDFAGCGDSEAPFTDNSLTTMISDSNACLAYILENCTVDKDRLGILGYSMGGRVTTEIISQKDTPYQAAVLLSAANATADTQAVNQFGSLENYNKLYEEAKSEKGYADFTTVYGQVQQLSQAWFDDIASSKPLEDIKGYSGALLVLYGDQDTVVTPEINQATAAAYPEARVVVISGADHGYGFYQEAPEVTALVQGNITSFFMQHLQGQLVGVANAISKYGNVGTDLPTEVLNAAGFAPGDIIAVTVDGQTLSVPYGTAYSNVDNGQAVIVPDTTSGTVAVAINMGNFASTYHVVPGTPIAFAMGEKEGYLEEYNIRNIDSLRTNNRSDYASDEVFANFRPIVMGGIAEGVLYRSSNPANNELGRAAYADRLIEAAGVQTVLNLANSQEELEGYFNEKDYDSPYYKGLYDAGQVCYLNMGVDFSDPAFTAKLKTGLEFMLSHSGPYDIHCNEGKDRAGFVAALLEAFMGGTVDEIRADYMRSYLNYYHVEEGSSQYNKIAESNIMNTLRTIAGLEKGADLTGVDLKKAATEYLVNTVGLTSEQVTALQAQLSTPITADKAA